jgi:CheY-like chemotaxis protein
LYSIIKVGVFNLRKRKKILLVEDDELMITLTRKMLIEEGYRVDAAVESGHAIKLLTFNEYDLVILDISMPTLSGFDLVQLMDSFQIECKTVFLTNLNDEDTLRKVKKIKVSRLISKEKDLKNLPQIIKEIIN